MLSRIRSSVLFSISGCLEGVLPLLPVARAQLVGLQRIEYTQHFRRVAAYRKIGDVDETDHTLRVDHEGGALGILDTEAGVAQRATFVVDPEGVIRFVYVTDLSVGRNPAEVLRVLDALQTDELCPCNWQKGQDTLKAA